MNILVQPGKVAGVLPAIASKSHLHRLCIAAALCAGETSISHGPLCDDIEATLSCLEALGAGIERTKGHLRIRGITPLPGRECTLRCGESGSTYRFLLPVAAALSASAAFCLEGRLGARPIADLAEEMVRHGVRCEGLGTNNVHIAGKLRGGNFCLPGNVSSQYITALLFAMPGTGEDCTLTVMGGLESAGYVDITLSVLREFDIEIVREGNVFHCPGRQHYHSPSTIACEGDWSNAAFCLAAAAAGGSCMQVSGLSADSSQGDKVILPLLARFGAKAELQDGSARVAGAPLRGCEIDLRPIPDMAMALCIPASVAEGETVLANCSRLRLKESDRVASTLAMLRGLSAKAWVEDDAIHIAGSGRKLLAGGEVDACGDHRIAMTAACFASVCEGPVLIRGAQCVAKSYPSFFEDIRRAGLIWEVVQ